ncbi:flagellar protein FlaG [Thiomicrorhabdus aquaedulcis]|uniref:flagellar protein FlaG n=1 Tax=Thiomicrorhabdus aquaedulcis TaxID=2211106 RepID=UPI000FD729E2|nr:flagellar protein FlaG [Thiomicrorhabdus aquaedulcis]
MNDFTSIQPNNLASMLYGKSEKPIASSDYNEVIKQDVLPEVLSRQIELNNLEYREVGGQINVAEIDSQVASLNSQMQKLQNYLKFERNEDSDRLVIFIKDSETDEVIRQIPTEDFLNISKSITQYLEMNNKVSEKVSSPVGLITNETV